MNVSDLPAVHIDSRDLADITVRRENAPRVTTTYFTWDGPRDRPVAVARELLETGDLSFPAAWDMVPVGRSVDARTAYFKRREFVN